MINFFVKVRLPQTIQTDKGSNFTSKLFERVTLVWSSAYHPQSQGALERFHSTIMNMLRAHCAKQRQDWDRGLPFVLFTARGAVQESLGFCPFELLYGRSVRGPLQIAKERWVEQEDLPKEASVDRLERNLAGVQELARKNLSQAQRKMKEKFNKRARRREFEKGEEVLLLSPNKGSPFNGKYQGPYTIAQKIDERNYQINTPEGRTKMQVCHINRLKKYIRRESQPVLAVTSEDQLVEDVETKEEGQTRKNPPPKLKNTAILNHMGEKLNHLSGS